MSSRSLSYPTFTTCKRRPMVGYGSECGVGVRTMDPFVRQKSAYAVKLRCGCVVLMLLCLCSE